MPTSPAIPHPPRPSVVTTINNTGDLEFARSADLTTLCHILEIRLDGLQPSPPSRAELESLHSSTPLILTARRKDEGGFSALDEQTRIDTLLHYMITGAMVDIELRTLTSPTSAMSLAQLVETIATHSGTIIASHHDFNGVPSSAQVSNHLACAREHHAITKIAATVNHTDQLQQWTERLTQLVESGQRFSFMGMGKFGMATRLTAASAGSELNYGFIQQASVPGQWPAKLLKATIAKLC